MSGFSLSSANMAAPSRPDPFKQSRESALVKSVRSAIAGIGAGATPATAERYLKIVARLTVRNEAPEHARSRQDFYSRRAALLFVEAQRAREALRVRDRAPEGSAERAQAVAELERIEKILQRYPPDPERQRHLSPGLAAGGLKWRDIAGDKPPAPRKSKRVGLGMLAKRAGWQEALLANICPRHRSALALALLTGCRPAELARGIRVQVVNNEVRVVIPGAKVGRDRGQPSRTLTLSTDSAAGRHLAALAGDGEVVVTVTSAKAFGAAVSKAGRRAWPRSRVRVSPYSLRHNVASQLRAADVTEEAIAACLGHRATRSQGAYGRACHGRADGLAILDAQAALPVRRTGNAPPRPTLAPTVAPTPPVACATGPRLR